MNSDTQAAAIRQSIQTEQQAKDELVLALVTIAEFPITDPKNQDAVNMKALARAVLRKAGAYNG